MSTTTWDVCVDLPGRDLDDNAAEALLEQLLDLRPGIVVGVGIRTREETERRLAGTSGRPPPERDD